jgi:hypothetical protein
MAKASPKQQRKISRVLREFKAGTLKSSSGEKITDPKRALAIALSEAGVSREIQKDKSDAYWDAYIDTMCGSMSKGGMEEEEEGEEEEEMEEEMDANAAEARCKGYLSSLNKRKKR